MWIVVSCAAALICAGPAWVLAAENVQKDAPAASAPGEAVNGLKLTLAADKTDLKIVPPDSVEFTKLTLTFTNVSDKPIKLDAYDWAWTLTKLEVTGPDANSVRVVEKLVDRRMAAPTEKNYPTIEPGATWSDERQPTFPTGFGPRSYILLRPGAYRIKVTYTATEAHQKVSERAKGAWIGSVTSNEVVLRVTPPDMQLPEAVKHPVFLGPVAAEPVAEKPAGKPDEAGETLKLTLAAEKTELKMGADGKVEPTKLTLTFTNVSDKPIKLNTYRWGLLMMKLDVKGPDADSVREGRVRFTLIANPPKPEDFPVLDPGKSWTDKNQPNFPGLFGQVAYILLKPGEYRVRVIYNSPENEFAAVTKEAAGYWIGGLTSNEIVLKVVK